MPIISAPDTQFMSNEKTGFVAGVFSYAPTLITALAELQAGGFSSHDLLAIGTRNAMRNLAHQLKHHDTAALAFQNLFSDTTALSTPACATQLVYTKGAASGILNGSENSDEKNRLSGIAEELNTVYADVAQDLRDNDISLIVTVRDVLQLVAAAKAVLLHSDHSVQTYLASVNDEHAP